MQHKVFTSIALLFMLIILPFGSYFYLKSGLNYFKDNMKLLVPKGQIADYQGITSNGVLVNRDSLLGEVGIHSFVQNPCSANCSKSQKLKRNIAEQFKNRRDIVLYSHLENADSSLQFQDLEKQFVVGNNWHYLSAQQSIRRSINLGDFEFPLVLVDDSLNVRRVYDGADSLAVNQLIRHVSMIMPRIPKSEIKFRREKEK